MCGRYALPVEPNELPREFGKVNLRIDRIQNQEQRSHRQYNVGPMTTMPVYFFTTKRSNPDNDFQKEHIIKYMKWGLIPMWITDSKQQQKNNFSTFNARYESLNENRLWKSSLHNRCVVPIKGYYEWKAYSKKVKQPYYIKRKDDKIWFLAGLYSKSIIDGEETYSFTVITREAPKQLAWLHERMPVVLDPETDEFTNWLDHKEEFNWGKLKSSLKVYEKDTLDWFKVSSKVGNIRNEDPDFIKPLVESKSVMSLMKSPKKETAVESNEEEHDKGDTKPAIKEEENIEMHLEDDKPIIKDEDKKIKEESLPQRLPPKRRSITDMLNASPTKKIKR